MSEQAPTVTPAAVGTVETPAPAQAVPPSPSPAPSATTPPAAPAAGAVVPPQEPVYTLSLPQDSVLDASAVDRLTAFAKGQGLDPKAAQSALEYANAETLAALERQKADYTAKVTGWETSVKADTELGGANYNRTLARTQAVLDRFAKPGSHKYADEFRAALNSSGFGNYPAFVWLIDQIGASMENDSTKHAPSGGQTSQVPLADRLFPSLAKTA